MEKKSCNTEEEIVKVTASRHRPAKVLGFNHKSTECFPIPISSHQNGSSKITVDDNWWNCRTQIFF